MRNEVWRAALIQDTSIDVTGKCRASEPALLSVSKQIRGEALGIYYGENKFSFEKQARGNSLKWAWLPWLQAVGPSRLSKISYFSINVFLRPEWPLKYPFDITVDFMASHWCPQLQHLVKELVATGLPLAAIHLPPPGSEHTSINALKIVLHGALDKIKADEGLSKR